MIIRVPHGRADNGSHFMTRDLRGPSVNWSVTRVTHDPWLTTTHHTSHCHSVTFVYPRDWERNVDAISISHCAYAHTPSIGAQ